MKRVLFGCAVVLALTCGPVLAAIDDNTPHDMRTRLGITQICLPCHAPHRGPAASEGPLWNHQLTTATFVRNGVTVTLTGTSKFCMSCHDGVTAVGNYGSITTSTDKITGGAALGTDLTDDHPIGADYAAAYSANPTWYKDASLAKGLVDGKVQCTSCHRVHSWGTDHKYLSTTIVGSALCKNCHLF